MTRSPGRLALDSIKRHAPRLYWRARNAVALGEWCWLRHAPARLRARGAEPYDDAFWDFHDVGDWAGFAALVIEFSAPRSVVDVGCGQGKLLEALRATDPSIRLQGLEPSAAARARAEARGLPLSDFDVAAVPRRALGDRAAALGPIDLAVCLEVAEHLPAWHGRRLLDFLTTWNTVLFSAAHPNQGGVLHVNEQPASYWIDRFGRRGFVQSPANEAFRARLAAIDLPAWYRENTHMFERR